MEHELKTWPEFFEEVWAGTKTFEVRKKDRPFSIGDTLILREWNPSTQDYTGRYIEKLVTYILEGGNLGLEEGFVIMAIQ